MAIAGSQSANAVRTGKHDIYFVDVPTSVAGADNSAKKDTYYGLFYADATIRKAMKAGVNVWATTSSDGIKFNLGNDVETVKDGNGDIVRDIVTFKEATIEFECLESDALRLQDMFNTGTTVTSTKVAATGKAGRTSTSIGNITGTKQVTALIQLPSEKFLGEFDNVLAYNCSVVPEIEIGYKDKDVQKFKVKLILKPSGFISDNGLGSYVDFDFVTAAAL